MSRKRRMNEKGAQRRALFFRLRRVYRRRLRRGQEKTGLDNGPAFRVC